MFPSCTLKSSYFLSHSCPSYLYVAYRVLLFFFWVPLFVFYFSRFFSYFIKVGFAQFTGIFFCLQRSLSQNFLICHPLSHSVPKRRYSPCSPMIAIASLDLPEHILDCVHSLGIRVIRSCLTDKDETQAL